MARIARGIGTFLLIPGIVLLVAGLLAAAIGYFGFDAAMASHQDPTLFSSGNDRATRERAELGAMLAVGGLIGAGIGLLLATLGGTIVSFSEDKRPAPGVENRSA